MKRRPRLRPPSKTPLPRDERQEGQTVAIGRSRQKRGISLLVRAVQIEVPAYPAIDFSAVAERSPHYEMPAIQAIAPELARNVDGFRLPQHPHRPRSAQVD